MAETKIRRKQLLVMGIIILLICIGYSGCTDTKNEELTPANIIIKNISYSPSNPVTNEEITFTITLENTGDKDDFSVITLSGKDIVTGNFTIQSGSFIIDGHSQKNVTVSTFEHILNEGMQSFEIGITGNQTIRTINIDIQPNDAPEIYYVVTGYVVKLNGTFMEKTTFTAGEVVVLHYLFRNVNHEGVVETFHNITVYYKGALVYSNNESGKSYTTTKTLQGNWPFTVEEFWPSGEYQIVINIQDKITGLTCSKTIYFTVV
jgi:uncharacterized repeat protein (TIGR01451 family)